MKPGNNQSHKEMGVIARDDREFTLIYSHNTRVGKHALAYLQGIKEKLNAVDISKTKVSDTQWTEIAEALNCKVGDLIDKRLVKAEDTSSYGTNDWLKILQNNDEVLSHPIAINGKVTRQIANGPDVLKFFGVDSAGLEKTMHTEDPTIESTTNNEDFIK
ncbi:arsenate reductase family protein [Rasiella sp. SM2506]|uniref:arsenate reductase family protein n=1 Tax=Rasiella sp. SM2506 TaxID=3423914 RepID=UPI003D7BDABF